MHETHTLRRCHQQKTRNRYRIFTYCFSLLFQAISG